MLLRKAPNTKVRNSHPGSSVIEACSWPQDKSRQQVLAHFARSGRSGCIAILCGLMSSSSDAPGRNIAAFPLAPPDIPGSCCPLYGGPAAG